MEVFKKILAAIEDGAAETRVEPEEYIGLMKSLITSLVTSKPEFVLKTLRKLANGS